MKAMNSHQLIILATCESGYIGKCKCCDNYNVVFNNQLFVFIEDDLRHFRQMLACEDTLLDVGNICCNGRTIAMRTPLNNFYLMFSIIEVEQFKNVLDEAFIMIEVNKILQY